MKEKLFETPCGKIHYWTNEKKAESDKTLVFLPGLTADHRLFDKQIGFFEERYRVLVWDPPEHAASWPFAQLFPEKLKGFISIDSAPLRREYVTAAELWLLKRMEPVYRHYPWRFLLKSGAAGVAESEYGRKLMHDIMMDYDGDRARYAGICCHGFRMVAEAMEADLPYEIRCPALLICGEKDRAGSSIRFNRAWHKKTGIPIAWIDGAGHNANTDAPELVNTLIASFLKGIR